MRLLKRILIVLLILIVIPLIAALFVRKDYAVEREVTINKPRQAVFDYIKLLKNQDHFSIWAMKDPGMQKTYKGTDGTPGFIASWQSQNREVGTGEQEIMKVTEGERIDFKLRFKVPFEAQDDAYMITEAVGDSQTKVKWGFKGAFPYPMNIMNLFINMDKEVGKDLATGLANLKTVMEQQ